MGAGPCFLSAAAPVIAVDAHVLGVVLALLVRALFADAVRLELIATVAVFLNDSICRALIVNLSLPGSNDLNGLATIGAFGALTVSSIGRLVVFRNLFLGARGGVVARVLLGRE